MVTGDWRRPDAPRNWAAVAEIDLTAGRHNQAGPPPPKRQPLYEQLAPGVNRHLRSVTANVLLKSRYLYRAARNSTG
jgi:hypothetical protein